MVTFGQIVIGPAGCGKTTYCAGFQQFYKQLNRDALRINLDFGNSSTAAIDVRDLITVEDAMDEFDLGPNGAMIYCMEYLEKNIDWLTNQLKSHTDKYLLFDTPGQIELTTHHSALKNIIKKLSKEIRLCGVHMVDLSYCIDGGKYIGALVYGLMSMLQLELPTIGVLSKIDLLKGFAGTLQFPLEFYTQVQDLEYLTTTLRSAPISMKYAGLSEALCTLITDFNLVSFHPLCITDKTSMIKLCLFIDKANGYCYQNLNEGNMFESCEKWNEWDLESRRVVEKYGPDLFDVANDSTFTDHESRDNNHGIDVSSERANYDSLVHSIVER